MTDYILTASRFDQVVERFDDLRPKKVIKHRRGDTITGLSEAEVDRLTRAGAIKPAGEAAGDAPATSLGTPLTAGGGGDGTPGAPVMPAKTAKTDEWQAYAVARGMDPAEAEAKSRADLIALYADGAQA